MPVPPETRLGPYWVVSPLGAGGMGEVYRATDTKLNRAVAIKVLPAAFAAEPERLARFEREAKLLASLNHPNIAQVYGFESATLDDGSSAHFLAMELVPGEDLAERLKRGAIPVDETLEIAKQIAEALEEAHDKGIIHRDLKPANVKLTPDGKVKVLDFGLARSYAVDQASGSGPDLSQSPTLAHTGTAAGLILGTAAYMSPEQARGKPVDKRADIFAFGVVLFEMLTGRRLFTGETVSDVLAGVLKTEIDLGALQEATPSGVRQLLRRCLERNPRNRLHDIADARLALEDSLAGRAGEVSVPGGAGATRLSPRRAAWPEWLLGIALGAGALAVLDRTWLSPGTAALTETLRLELLPPEGTHSSGPFDLSADGRSLAFVAADSNNATALYLRELDTLEARKLPGTEGADMPFFSPSGRSVGFFANKKLQRIDLAGGPPRELASVSDPRGASWGASGAIVFAPEGGGPILSIPENGGDAVAATRLDPAKQETSHRWPLFLPDGKHFVFMSRKPGTPRLALEVGSVSGEERIRLVEADAGGRYAAGKLFFQRRTTVLSQAFDTVSHALSGEPTALAEDAWLDPDTDGLAALAVARDGRLAYRRGGLATGRLAWLDRDGRTQRTVGEPGLISHTTLSPDERRIVVVRTSPQGKGHLQLLVDASSIGMVISRPDSDSTSVIFAPDGSRIVFAEDRNGPFDLYELKLAEPGKDAPLLVSPLWKYPETWSPDGRLIVYTEVDPKSRANLWVLPRTADATPYPFLATPASETGARFSPDGRFLAHTSDESGREEVFVQPFPATGAKWQVSAAGGSSASWRADGREVFYVAPDSRLMSVAVSRSPAGLAFGPPRALFRIPQKSKFGFGSRSYAVSRDGQRFLVIERPSEAASSPIAVVVGDAARGGSNP